MRKPCNLLWAYARSLWVTAEKPSDLLVLSIVRQFVKPVIRHPSVIQWERLKTGLKGRLMPTTHANEQSSQKGCLQRHRHLIS